MSTRPACPLPSTLTCKLQAQYIVHDPPPITSPTNSARPTSNLLDGSRRDCPLSFLPLGFLQQCALFATLDMQIGGLLQRATASLPAGETALRALASNRRVAKRRTNGGRMPGQRALTSS